MAETKTATASRPSLAISDPKELALIEKLVTAEYQTARKSESTPDEELHMLYDLRQRVQRAAQKAGAVTTSGTASSSPSATVAGVSGTSSADSTGGAKNRAATK